MEEVASKLHWMTDKDTHFTYPKPKANRWNWSIYVGRFVSDIDLHYSDVIECGNMVRKG